MSARKYVIHAVCYTSLLWALGGSLGVNLAVWNHRLHVEHQEATIYRTPVQQATLAVFDPHDEPSYPGIDAALPKNK